jgi:hypothetical protein
MGIVRTLTELYNHFADGQPDGSIVPSRLRDLVATLGALMDAVRFSTYLVVASTAPALAQVAASLVVDPTDHAAVESAIAANRRVCLVGTFTWATGVTINTSNREVFGIPGMTVVQVPTNNGNPDQAGGKGIYVTGSQLSSAGAGAPQGDIAEGTVTLNIGTHSNPVGSWLRIRVNRPWSDDRPGSNNTGEWGEIISTTSTTVTFRTPLMYSYAQADTIVFTRMVLLENVVVRNIEFQGTLAQTSSTQSMGLAFNRTRGCEAYGITAKDLCRGGVEFRNSVDGLAERCRFYRCSTAGAPGAGLLIFDCLRTRGTNIIGENCRHTVDIDGSNTPSRYIDIVGARSYNDLVAGLGSHPGCEFISFTACYAVGSGGGFMCRGRSHTLNDCHVVGPNIRTYRHGFSFGDGTGPGTVQGGGIAGTDLLMSNCSVDLMAPVGDPQFAGIHFNASVERAVITNTRLKGFTGPAIRLIGFRLRELVLDNVLIDGSRMVAGQPAILIQPFQAAAGHNQQGLVARNIRIANLPEGSAPLHLAGPTTGTPSSDIDLRGNAWAHQAVITGLVEGVQTDDALTLRHQQAPPTAPAAGQMRLFARSLGGRMIPHIQGPSGLSTPLQPSFFQNAIQMIAPGTSTTLTIFGIQAVSVGTVSHPTVSEQYGHMANFASAATAAATAGTGGGQVTLMRGVVPGGANGFFTAVRMALPDSSYDATGVDTGTRVFVGMTNQAMAASVASDNPAGNLVGFFRRHTGGGAQDANWQIASKDNSVLSLQDTGMPFLPQKVYDMCLYCAPVGTEVRWRIDNVTDGTTAEGVVTERLPSAGNALRAGLQLQTVDAAVRNIRMQRIYVEADR